MKRYLCLLLIALAFGLQSCEKQEITIAPRDYPVPEITVNTVPGKVELTTRLINRGNQEIVKYGFEWDLTNGEGWNFRKEFTGDPGDNFSYNITAGLTKGEQYEVRPFVITGKVTVYGGIRSFTSPAMSTPVISSLIPQKGTFGDTIVIEGANFSLLKNQNIVHFNSLTAEVITSEENRLVCIVPECGDVKKATIKVKCGPKEGISSTYFEYFSIWNQMKVINLQTKFATSFVIGNRGYIIQQNDSRVFEFNPDDSTSTFYNYIPVNSGTIPLSASDGTSAVGLFYKKLYHFTPSEGWTYLSDYPAERHPFDFLFYLDGNVYVGSLQQELIYKYEPSLQKWTTLHSEVPGHTPVYAACHSINGKGYLIMNYTWTDAKLYIYHPSSNNWEPYSYPLISKGWSCQFFMDGRLYAGLGAKEHDNSLQSVQEMKYFDLIDKQWYPYKPAPRAFQCEMSITINGKGYTFLRNSMQVWEFDPNRNK